MRVIIAGSRSITSMNTLLAAIERCPFSLEITEVVSGDANGPDTLGVQWASSNQITVSHFPAKWQDFGKRAGFKRNAEMAEYADALIALWDGKSNGTRDMIAQMKRKGKQTFVFPCYPVTLDYDGKEPTQDE
jgi:hypothetical protein